MGVPLTVGSLFSGLGSFDHGAERAGWRTLWFCEKDEKARRVLAKHWPDVPCHEDITTLDGRTLPPVTLIMGGFPCQDLSYAGQREGLSKGTRSGLFFEMVRVIDEARPLFVLWENVPGLLSGKEGDEVSDEPEDALTAAVEERTPVPSADGPVPWMEIVLGELSRIGYFGAYRVLDSLHFGVPQRRRRVFGLFARGDTGDGNGLAAPSSGIDAFRLANVPAQVLLEREGVRGHPGPRGSTQDDHAAPAGDGPAKGRRRRGKG